MPNENNNYKPPQKNAPALSKNKNQKQTKKKKKRIYDLPIKLWNRVPITSWESRCGGIPCVFSAGSFILFTLSIKFGQSRRIIVRPGCRQWRSSACSSAVPDYRSCLGSPSRALLFRFTHDSFLRTGSLLHYNSLLGPYAISLQASGWDIIPVFAMLILSLIFAIPLYTLPLT